jgi:hypothetical protein
MLLAKYVRLLYIKNIRWSKIGINKRRSMTINNYLKYVGT